MTLKIKIAHKISVILSAIILVLVTISINAFAETVGGKTYYVSADGSNKNNGLSEDSPISLFQANSTLLKGGDKILFKRGDIFYGEFTPIISGTNNTSRVTIGAYGKGELPKLSNAKIIDVPWTASANGFYKFILSKDGNYKGVNNQSANVGFFSDEKSNIYGNRKKDAVSCKAQYDFYCDDTAIYVKTGKDPYEDIGKLSLAIHGCLINLNQGVNVSDLHLTHCGYGICWKSGLSDTLRKFSDIKNCVIENMGGTVIDEKTFTRAGNGIELYNAGTNVNISNNLFRNTYDVAFTCQGSGTGQWKNITVSNNIFAYCTQAIEIWCGASSTGAGIYALNFTDNLCIKQGEGWGTVARDNKESSTDVLIYGYTPNAWQMVLENNTFYHSSGEYDAVYYVHAATVEKFIKFVKTDKNYIYHESENSTVLHTDDSQPEKYKSLNKNFAEWKALSGKDTQTAFNTVGKAEKYKPMEALAASSCNFNEIAKSAENSGLTVKLTYNTEKAEAQQNLQNNEKKDSDIATEEKLPLSYVAIAAVTVVLLIVLLIIILKKKK